MRHMTSNLRSLSICFLVSLIGLQTLGQPPAPQHAERPPFPTRDPHTPGYVAAKELPDGSVPPADADGNFVIGPTYNPPADEGVRGSTIPQGTVIEFTMKSAD